MTVAGALLLLAGGALEAQERQVDVGWWTRSPAQGAPDGGFAVANAPDGPLTVAALAVPGSDGATSASLEVVETGGLGQDGASIEVCVASTPWTPIEGGALADAPEADCDAGQATLERDGPSARWRADLTGLLAGTVGDLSVVLRPAQGEGPIGPSPFDVRFAQPSFTVVGVPSGSTGGDGGTDEPFAPSDPSDGSAAPSEPAPSSSGGFDSGTSTPFGVPAAPSPAITPGAPVESAPQPLGVVEDGVTAPAGALTAPRPLIGSTDVEASAQWGQALAFVLVSLVAAIAAGGANRWRRLNGRPA
ncbi:MAG TPA: hypothetical protein VMN58_00310 [Acidimicrobiales bacterium]|nr:hypothetical protein [Acidimicrobiales bacterium]